MSVLFQAVINNGKHFLLRKSLSASKTACKCLLARKLSDTGRKFKTFDEIVAQRRKEARRSVVVQVNSASSFNELNTYCSKYASVNGIHHYKNTTGEHFMLIEFSSEENLNDALRSCSAHQKDMDVMALQSPFLWFRAVSGKKMVLKPSQASLVVTDGTKPVNDDQLFSELLACETVSEQIQLLYDRTVLNDLGVRLRYMVARQLEILFGSLYANIAVMPFGSSVNGFGKNGSDLDLVLTNVVTNEMSNPDKRLVFQEKKCEGGRSPWQRHMELVGELIELRVPGASRVQKILHARVPIVKYAHELTGIDVDLCYNNMSGIHMSALLYELASLDARTRPLAAAVRRWARAAALTSPHPGRWITNFPLTLMVVFFLQQRTSDGNVLPPLKSLIGKTGKENVKLSEDTVNGSFVRDLNSLPPDSYGQSRAELQTLLLQFFEYYSQFDFGEKAICINEGVPIRKPNALPLYIVNPLEPELNVSRNVSYEECERVRTEVRNAAWQLDSYVEGPKGEDWGLLGLIEQRSTRGLKKLLRVGNSHRLLSVKDLFDDQKMDENEGSIGSRMKKIGHKTDKQIEHSVKEMKLAMIKEERKEQKMKFKNSQTASEVFRIRRDKIV